MFLSTTCCNCKGGLTRRAPAQELRQLLAPIVTEQLQVNEKMSAAVGWLGDVLGVDYPQQWGGCDHDHLRDNRPQTLVCRALSAHKGDEVQ